MSPLIPPSFFKASHLIIYQPHYAIVFTIISINCKQILCPDKYFSNG